MTAPATTTQTPVQVATGFAVTWTTSEDHRLYVTLDELTDLIGDRAEEFALLNQGKRCYLAAADVHEALAEVEGSDTLIGGTLRSGIEVVAIEYATPPAQPTRLADGFTPDQLDQLITTLAELGKGTPVHTLTDDQLELIAATQVATLILIDDATAKVPA